MVRRLLLALVLPGLLLAVPAKAHSYADPALRVVFDGVQPTALPAGVVVEVRPSVVDELVVSNPTATPLVVLAVGGEPFLRISSAGVQANFASPDWYSTGTPEGGPVPPADVLRDKGRGTPRWARVSKDPIWSEFDARLRPRVAATPEIRAAGKDRVLAVWRIPLRYGATSTAATGHVLFSPIRGGLAVAVTRTPAGVTANALQGELPGLFLSAPAGTDVVVEGRDGAPFLRFHAGTVLANTASVSWVQDQQARGRTVPQPGGAVSWVEVANGRTYSWLDGRLRYPSDVPPRDVLARTSTSVVQRWSVPVTVDGIRGAIEGTVSWVPRKVALQQLRAAREVSHRSWWPVALLAAGLGGAGAVVVVRRRRT